jgi:hypothetical protein
VRTTWKSRALLQSEAAAAASNDLIPGKAYLPTLFCTSAYASWLRRAGPGSSHRAGRARQEPAACGEARTRTVSFYAGAHGTSAAAVEPCTNRRTLIQWNALSDAEAERCCDRNVGERESAHDELAITEALLEHVEMQ